MSKLKVRDLNMASQVLKQYRDLTLQSNKLFYYAYGKLDIKIQAILKNKYIDIEDLLEDEESLVVKIHYDELEELISKESIRKRDIDVLIDNIDLNGSIKIDDGNGVKTYISIYDTIIFNSRSRYITVYFNPNAILLFQSIRNSPYGRIEFSDVVHLENKYQMNLYLYCLTVLRGDQGVVTQKISSLRESLAKESELSDTQFFHRFISKASRDINDDSRISIKVKPERDGDNITLKVYRK